jgi:hypothetical protein
MEARGIRPNTPWFGCNGCSDFNTPAGDFAETFAYLLLGPGNFSGKIASAPTGEQAVSLKTFFTAELQPPSLNPANAVEAQASAPKVTIDSAALAKK